MPLYMDLHDTSGVTPEELARAHDADLAIQSKHGVNFITYWFDYERQVANCLVDAPNPSAVVRAHAEAHGSLPSRIIPTTREDVLSFMGSISDPVDGSLPGSGLRAIVFTDIVGSTEYMNTHGDARGMEALRAHNALVREATEANHGSEIKNTGDGFLLSFARPSDAVQFSLDAVGAMERHWSNDDGALRVRIGVNAGEPVAEDGDLFGSAVTLASRICDAADDGAIWVSEVVRSLTLGKGFSYQPRGSMVFKGFDEPMSVYEAIR